MMKKLLSLMLTLAFCASFAAAQEAKPTATPIVVRDERPTKPTKEPETPDEFYEAARWEQFENSDYDTAIILLGKAIALDPAFADAYNFRGNLYSQQKKCKAAITDFTAVIEQVGDAPNTYQYRAECKIALKDLSGALLDLDASVASFSAKGQMQYNSLFKRAKLKYLLKNYDGAIVDFNTLVNNSRFAGDTQLVFYRALTYMKKGDNDNAVADFKLVSDYYFQITASSRRENPELYAEDKDYPPGENPLATLNKPNKETLKTELYGTASAESSGGIKCKGCPKIEYADFGDKLNLDSWFYSEKVFPFKMVIDDANLVFYFTGNLLEQKGDASGAIEAFTNAINAKPYRGSDNALFYLQRGKVLLQTEDFEPAVKDFSWTISLSRGFADAYLERGIAILMLGHDALARKDFDIYAALDKTPTAKENLNKRVAEAKKQREEVRRDEAVQPKPESVKKNKQPN